MNNELRQSLRWIEDQLRDIQTLLASLVDHSAHASIVAPMKTPHGPEDLNDDSFEGATQRFHDEITRIADVARMQMPHLWPRRPFLCLRHATLVELGLPKLGLLYEHSKGCVEPVVYCANVYDIGRAIRTEEQLRATAYERYDSFVALVGDGWIID